MHGHWYGHWYLINFQEIIEILINFINQIEKFQIIWIKPSWWQMNNTNDQQPYFQLEYVSIENVRLGLMGHNRWTLNLGPSVKTDNNGNNKWLKWFSAKNVKKRLGGSLTDKNRVEHDLEINNLNIWTITIAKANIKQSSDGSTESRESNLIINNHHLNYIINFQFLL